ncbi:hypothetical protein OEZ85_002016 [Tetradesmus obliquus]|uniref:Uncharacterized protein n=1 Tax=Tetradesmus obliquus TaxID=3088 RepID=A0ABY8U4G1_TETOB|nr:hypothetical protein OEZ85_002016 [Tetradesmus obliquus]
MPAAGCSSSPVRRSSPGRTVLCGSGRYDPVNYLTRGGARAADKANEEKLVRLNKAAMKDLQLANTTLANELVRLQSTGGEERQALREEVVKLELLLQAQNDKIDLLQNRLADAQKQNEEAEQKHHSRLKEVARRLKEDHLSKLKALQEAHNQLLAELAAQQEDSTQLLHTRDQLGKVSARLEMESASRAELWQRCTSLEQELRGTQDALDATSSQLKQAEKQLDHAGQVEKQLAACEKSLQAERVAHSKLQADATLERSQAAALRAEVERLRREVGSLTKRSEAGDDERATLKLALADAQAAAADAAVEVRAASARAERLEQELELVRQEADSQAASLRSQAAAREERLAAQHASRMAALQSELDARGAAACDSDSALSAARAEITRLTQQGDSLRHIGDAAGSQLATAQSRVEQLQQQLQAKEEQLKETKVHVLQQEAALSELLASQKSSSSTWTEERQQLEESTSKWRQKAMQLQQELESKSDQAVSSSQAHAHEVAKLQVALDNAAAELALVRRQLASAEEERTSAAKRSSALLVQWEERDRGQSQEVTTLRARLVDLQEAHDAARSEAEVHRQQLRATQQELESATLALADEQARLAALRAELGALEREKGAEVDARLRSVQELSAALAAEQQARLDAQLELHRAKKKQATVESQLQAQRIQTLSRVLDAKAKADEAATNAAALAAAERKAKQYRADSSSMLSDYESWVQGLLDKKTAAGAAAGSIPAGRDGLGQRSPSLSARSSGLLASPQPASKAMSPQASFGSRSAALSLAAAAAAAGSRSPGGGDLEKYDRIAALLEGRAGGSGSGTAAAAGAASAGLSRSLSGKSISLTGGSLSAAASPLKAGSGSGGRPGSLAAAAKGSPSTPSRASFR